MLLTLSLRSGKCTEPPHPNWVDYCHKVLPDAASTVPLRPESGDHCCSARRGHVHWRSDQNPGEDCRRPAHLADAVRDAVPAVPRPD